MSCLIGKGTKQDGYVRVNFQGKKWLLHRLAWVLRWGPVPEGLVVRHKCHNRACWNIEHLEIGTQSENILDSVRRGTHYKTRTKRDKASKYGIQSKTVPRKNSPKP